MKHIKLYEEDVIDDLKDLGINALQGWEIDHQSTTGPDYNFKSVIIIIAANEKKAIQLLPDAFGIPKDDFEGSATLLETVENILESDYITGAGWEMEVNFVEHYPTVKARKPGHYREFYSNEGSTREGFLEMGEKTQEMISKYLK